MGDGNVYQVAVRTELNLQIPTSPGALTEGRLTLGVVTSSKQKVVEEDDNTIMPAVDRALAEADAVEEVVRLKERFATEAMRRIGRRRRET